MQENCNDQGHLQLDAYKAAALNSAGYQDYKGLAIHTYEEVHQKVADILKDSLPTGAQILDLAAGSGSMCLRLRDLGFIPTACDAVLENFKMIGEIEFLKINLNSDFSEIINRKFDCIVAVEIIEHLENTRHFLRQCYKMLKADGLIVVSTPNIGSVLSRATFLRTGDFRWFREINYKHDGHITPIPNSVLRTALDEVGFVKQEFMSVVTIMRTGLSKMWLLAAAVRLLAKGEMLAGDVIIATARRL
jgi:2-polyprenyl-3-methyl-5-hydroxy-6-metoxy-1,4-benzoquinol methylase